MGVGSIVVGTDGGPGGDAVVRKGALLAEASGALLHIVGTEASLSRARGAIDDRDVRVEVHAAEGELTGAVWEVAERVNADLIVSDRARKGRIGRALSAIHRRLAPHAFRAINVTDLQALKRIASKPPSPGPSPAHRERSGDGRAGAR